MDRRKFGSIAAAAAFAILGTGAALHVASAAQDGAVMCEGVNGCKGLSECKTATHECKGLNSCKGEGWATKSSAEECRAAGGKVIS